jgi:hypothetical protein
VQEKKPDSSVKGLITGKSGGNATNSSLLKKEKKMRGKPISGLLKHATARS